MTYYLFYSFFYLLGRGEYHNNNNKSFTSSQGRYTYIHTYSKSLRYNRKIHQQLEMLFVHHYTLGWLENQNFVISKYLPSGKLLPGVKKVVQNFEMMGKVF